MAHPLNIVKVMIAVTDTIDQSFLHCLQSAVDTLNRTENGWTLVLKRPSQYEYRKRRFVAFCRAWWLRGCRGCGWCCCCFGLRAAAMPAFNALPLQCCWCVVCVVARARRRGLDSRHSSEVNLLLTLKVWCKTYKNFRVVDHVFKQSCRIVRIVDRTIEGRRDEDSTWFIRSCSPSLSSIMSEAAAELSSDPEPAPRYVLLTSCEEKARQKWVKNSKQR